MGIKRFVRCITAVILIAFALFIFLSFLSYSPKDPPFADYPINNPIHNFCGMAGAQVAGYAIASMGRTSYLIVILIGWLGVQHLYKESIECLWVRVIGAVLVVFSISSLLTLGCYFLNKALLSTNVGGIFGIVIVSRLYEYFNGTGTIIVLGLGFIISIMLLLNFTPISPFIKESETKLKEGGSTTHRDFETKKVHSLRLQKQPRVIIQTSWLITVQKSTDICSVDALVEVKKELCRSGSVFEKMQKPDNGKQCLEEEEHEEIEINEETDIYNTVPVGKKECAYELPPRDLLEKPAFKEHADDWDQITQRAQVLKNTLEQFNVNAEVVEIERGPVIAMYELELSPGTKVGKVVSLSDDLAIALKAPSVRVVAPLPGKASIGLEVPNTKRKTVMLRELLESSGDIRKKMAIPLLIGKDAAGNPLISDLASMPHLLIAGTTGSGKSVCLNSIILSILFLRHPTDVQLLLVDPKMVEFALFQGDSPFDKPCSD